MSADELQKRIKALFSRKGFGIVVIGLVAGIILLLLPKNDTEAEPVQTDSALTSAEYCLLLEQKAEEMICRLDGVDACSVFITLDKGYRYVYATDQRVREESGSKETEKTIVLAGNGNGENAILIEETLPTVAGVAVVCKGASYETQYRIIGLMCALFDINSNRISVQTN